MGGFVGDFLGAPEAPDPYATAAAQGQINSDAIRESAMINQMGINMPGYNVNYTGEIGDPNRTMNFNLSPEQQQLAQIMSGASYDTMGGYNAPDFSGVPGIPGVGTYAGEGGRVEDATYDALMSRLSPVMDRNQRRLDTQLSTTGIPMGSEAYNDMQGQFNRDRFDQELGIANTAINSGRAEQGRLFGQGMASNQQGMANVATESQLPLSSLAQLISMNPINNSQTPGQPAYQVAPADLAGLVANNYAAESSQYGSMLGGLSMLGGAALMSPVGTFT